MQEASSVANEDMKSDQRSVSAMPMLPDSKNRNNSNETPLGQDTHTNAEKRRQGESHLLQLRKGTASNKPIFTSIFGSPSSNKQKR